jgi:hypothetical protein
MSEQAAAARSVRRPFAVLRIVPPVDPVNRVSGIRAQAALFRIVRPIRIGNDAHEAMPMWSHRIAFDGDYSGHRDAGITFRFRFCSDGVYFYAVEQPGRWRLAHRGRYQLGRTRDPKYRDRTMTIVRFEPEHHDVPLADRAAVAMLEERALLVNRTEEYIVSASEMPDDWRANTTRTTYSFMRPDPKSRLFSTTWSIEADN